MMTDQIDGTTRLFAIIGDPVSGVRSPQVFNAMFARHGANAVLVALRVSTQEITSAWTGVKAMRNLEGVIFTMPHKVAAARLVDVVGRTGEIVGAINAARREPDGRWTGDMFDGAGCVSGLLAEGHPVAGRTVFVLGAGGAGAAIIAALANAGVSRLVVDDIDARRRDAVLERVVEAFPQGAIEAGTLESGPFDIAINATPLGMKEGDPLPFDPASLPSSTLVVDVIPKPEITPLLERARLTGHRIHPGRHMTLGQANDIARFFRFNPGG